MQEKINKKRKIKSFCSHIPYVRLKKFCKKVQQKEIFFPYAFCKELKKFCLESVITISMLQVLNSKNFIKFLLGFSNQDFFNPNVV